MATHLDQYHDLKSMKGLKVLQDIKARTVYQ